MAMATRTENLDFIAVASGIAYFIRKKKQEALPRLPLVSPIQIHRHPKPRLLGLPQHTDEQGRTTEGPKQSWRVWQRSKMTSLPGTPAPDTRAPQNNQFGGAPIRLQLQATMKKPRIELQQSESASMDANRSPAELLRICEWTSGRAPAGTRGWRAGGRSGRRGRPAGSRGVGRRGRRAGEGEAGRRAGQRGVRAVRHARPEGGDGRRRARDRYCTIIIFLLLYYLLTGQVVLFDGNARFG